MRIKNKEIRRRRHRKEQKIKEAAKVLREQYGDRKATAPAAKPKPPTRRATSKAK
jgi:hypothetical protein